MLTWTPRTATIAELQPYERNPRMITKEAYDRLKSDIERFGYHDRIKCQPGGLIIGGHQRLKALKELGFKEVEILEPSRKLTFEEYRELLIKDNLPYGSHDWNILSADFDVDELVKWGMPEEWLTGKIEPEKATEDEADEQVPDVPEKARTKPGEIWVLGRHRLLVGDSKSPDAVRKLMDGKTADMVFTDPPYGVDYKGIKNDSREGLRELLTAAFENYKASAKKGAAAYVFHSDKCADIFHEVFRKYCHFSSMIIWCKPALVLSQTDYQSQHEPCLYGWFLGGTHVWHSDRKQTSLWLFGKENSKDHTTPKPVAFCAQAMLNSSKDGDLVIDFFAGSGTTLIAAEKTGRCCNAVELDPRYCDVIIQRWQEFSKMQAHNAESGQLFDDVTVDGGATN